MKTKFTYGLILLVIGIVFISGCIDAKEKETQEEPISWVECNSCADCEAKINSAQYGTGVKLTEDAFADELCIKWNADNVTFDCQEHTINGSKYYVYPGIVLSGADNNILRNCRVTNFNTGIKLYNSSNNLVVNNVLSSNKVSGIQLQFSHNNVLSDNTATSNNLGVSLYSSTYNTISDNMVSSNKYEDEGRGISLSFESSYNIISGNIVNLNSVSGIYLAGAGHNSVTNNTVMSNGKYGINLIKSGENTLTSNVVCNNTDTDINIQESADNSGRNNTCDRADNLHDEGTQGCTYECL